MNTETVDALLEINRLFYRRHAAAFDASRETPWPGWHRVLEVIASGRPAGESSERALRRPLSVLDIGCGNGRFASYLLGSWPGPVLYLGLDSCSALLRAATERLREHRAEVRLERCELAGRELDQVLRKERFDLVGVFGLMHHVPGAVHRQELISRLARRLVPGGVLTLSIWQLQWLRRLEQRIVTWDSYNQEASLGRLRPVDLGQLEPGDRLLTWGGDSDTPRYCHFPDATEITSWLRSVDLPIIDRFEADGPSGRDNLYLVFRKPAREV